MYGPCPLRTAPAKTLYYIILYYGELLRVADFVLYIHYFIFVLHIIFQGRSVPSTPTMESTAPEDTEGYILYML